MGLYDRDYARDDEERPRAALRGPQTMVTTLLIANAVIYLLDVFVFVDEQAFGAQRHLLSEWMSMYVGSLLKPWFWWQALTSGFVHDPGDVFHIVLNMFGLWMFGRDIERRYGRREFLRIYLVAIVISSFAWAVFGAVVLQYGPMMHCLGASGAVSAIVILWVLHNPKATVLFMFVIPMPAWMLGALWVGLDMVGGFSGEGNVAHSAHLAGMAFAALYFWYRGRRLGRGGEYGGQGGYRDSYGGYAASYGGGGYGGGSAGGGPAGGGLGGFFADFRWPKLRWPRRRPELKIHDPEEKYRRLDEEADRVLAKLGREGEKSLTSKERRILEDYSRRMQQKHR